MRYKEGMKTVPIALLTLLGFAIPAQAEVYKCRQPDGRTEISNSPCSGGSTTLKAIPDDTVSEASRKQAERDADRLENYTDNLEAERKADEAAERKLLKEQQAAARQGPSAASVEHCLKTLHKKLIEDNITSVAIPRLATGVGGLEWDDVRPLIHKHLADLPIPVILYATYHPGERPQEPGL